VIAKRPIGNAVWRYSQKPENSYHQPYWERLQKLKYDFVAGDPKQTVAIALGFTLSVPGVHTAIVGSAKPGRWRENAALVESKPLARAQFEAIRAHWRQVANADWAGQI
jgi:aryl-alcohol dehydrogenase-like predicted oxidoreductase